MFSPFYEKPVEKRPGAAGQLKNMLTHLSLFSGIGGLDLAAEWAGFETVGQCEWADYPTKVLEKHWPDVPRWRDISDLTKESFYERTGLQTVDIISGGFPCQPFSVAGKHGGKEDDRYLWPEMLRVITELQPTWVIGENVPGIVNLAIDEVLSTLEAKGYEVWTIIIPACGVNAWHKRERVCIMAYNSGKWDGINRTSENAGTSCEDRTSDRRRTAGNDMWEWRDNKPDMGRMVSRICEKLDWPNSNTESVRLQGRTEKQIFRGGGYRHQLTELIETSPEGIIGRLNPTWIEWLMGFPTGWTELNV